jgi:molecular chaperone HtpG
MLADQKSIYFITGDNDAKLRNSPLLEAYTKKDIEVLIMDDEIDEIVIPSIDKYKDVELKGVNRSDAGEDLGKGEKEKADDKDIGGVIEKIKKALGDRVKDVKVSVRLAESPSCIVTDESDPTFKMAAMMKAMGQKEMPDIKPILEINPGHEIVGKLKGMEDAAFIEDVSFLLLEQALLVEGVELKDPAAFVKRLNRIMVKAV